MNTKGVEQPLGSLRDSLRASGHSVTLMPLGVPSV